MSENRSPHKQEFERVIGHRGACGYAPENTLAAMEKAYELGLHWVEFDVQLTANREVIVIHDTSLDRTTNGSGEVSTHSYVEIEKLDAGSWFNARFREERVPTLAAVLAYLSSHKISPVIEIKPRQHDEDMLVQHTLKTFYQYWDSSLPFLISSFSSSILAKLRQHDSLLPLALGYDKWDGLWEPQVKKLHCHSIHMNHKLLTAKRVAEVKSAGCGLYSYTVNDPQRALELFSWGVDKVFSDYPDKIVGLLSIRK